MEILKSIPMMIMLGLATSCILVNGFIYIPKMITKIEWKIYLRNHEKKFRKENNLIKEN